MKERLLIICYSFPPHPGIGGRRWAKFSKELSSAGYEILVVNANNVHDTYSLWTGDVSSPNIYVHSLHFSFQKILKNPKGFFSKVFRKVIIFLSGFTRYRPDIITSYPNKSNWRKIKNLITREKIKKVIVSGDPYLFYSAALLKRELDIELTLDYRDLWNDHQFYSTHLKFTKKQKDYFEFAENYAVNHCNKIIFVDENLQSVVKKRISNSGVKTFVVNNGYDVNDFPVFGKTNVNNAGIKLFFAGNVATDLNKFLLDFIQAFEKFSNENRSKYQEISISVSGDIDDELIEKINKFGLERVRVKNGKLNMYQYYEELHNADIGLVILSEDYQHSFITKFTDYLYCDKFIVALGPRGSFADFIEKRGIGLTFDPLNSNLFFENLIAEFRNRKTISSAEKEVFNVVRLTEKLEKILND